MEEHIYPGGYHMDIKEIKKLKKAMDLPAEKYQKRREFP